MRVQAGVSHSFPKLASKFFILFVFTNVIVENYQCNFIIKIKLNNNY